MQVKDKKIYGEGKDRRDIGRNILGYKLKRG
jgi:hypothetical protein